ncbi:MAG: chloride channel protein [Acidobacteriota bacterium]
MSMVDAWRSRLRRLAEQAADWRRNAELILARRFGLATPQDRRFFLLIPVVGVLAGLLGVAVHKLIYWVRVLIWGSADLFASAAERPLEGVVIATLIGGLVIGATVFFSKEKVSGWGMGVLIESVILRRGRVPARPVTLRSFAAVATVGAGGSLGREGPMIRLGAMIASELGARLRLTTHQVKVLVGCGAAAGLAAAYNIPVGGAVFAMEIILGNFALEIFGPIVVASVIATLIARNLEGNVPSYEAGDLVVVGGGWDIAGFVGLGLIGALVSLLFTFGVRSGHLAFGKLRLPLWAQPIIGMVLLGAFAYWTDVRILGSGADLVNLTVSMDTTLTLGTLLLLAIAKVVATALTAGSGGSGGLFTPSLTVGALTGAAYGYAIHTAFPTVTSDWGVYAAVGMAAVAAGTSHAPITAILVLVELTGNYNLILPLMTVSIIASFVARLVYPYSTYTESLERRGVDINWRLEEAALSGLKVGDLTRADEDVLRPADDYRTVVSRFLEHHRQRLFVVDDRDRLIGSISLHDIKHVLDEPEVLIAVVAHDLMTDVPLVLGRDDSLRRAVDSFAQSDFERMPVVDEAGVYGGVLAKRDLLALYSQEVLGRPALLATFVQTEDPDAGRDYVELPPDFGVRLVTVPPVLVGRTLAAARLPQTMGVTMLQLRRAGAESSAAETKAETRMMPDGDTVLEADDKLILLGPVRSIDAIDAGDLRFGTEGLAIKPASGPIPRI